MNISFLNKFDRLRNDAVNYALSGDIPLLYFDTVKNVGDLVSGYLVSRLSGKGYYKCQTKMLPHLSAVGSTLGVVSEMSHIWGSGSIDGQISNKGLIRKKVHALRGQNTLTAVNKYFSTSIKCPLGDPAVLMADYFDKEVPVQNKFGLIPHFDEYEVVKALVEGVSDDVKIIDVRQDPENFINDLRGCALIASSSLHGLILADSYEVPSIWFSASSKLLGGTWKFLDYFTCTDFSVSTPYHLNDKSDMLNLLNYMSNNARVRKYKYSKKDLISSYPNIF